MNMHYATVIGWIGSVLILLAFALTSFEILLGNNIFYLLLNLFGAGGIIINTLHHKDYPPMFLNSVWLLVAAVNLVRILFF